ncbi:unnamed protein product [Rhizoctonia solani]|uniref:Uncharacterized protein n=1 Tax=Rhizoctonia solani TaxID=456999 RepID=A0A8H2X3C5_9AGAM|nr:unnamed protein product [Rhizoctonia solani]
MANYSPWNDPTSDLVYFEYASTTLQICKKAALLYGFGTVIQFSVISSVFLVRCWALYGQQRLLWGLLFALACSVVYSTVITALTLNKAIYLVNPLKYPVPSLSPGCPILLPWGTWLIYLAPVIYELLVFILTAWKMWKMNKENKTTPLAQRLARK